MVFGTVDFGNYVSGKSINLMTRNRPKCYLLGLFSGYNKVEFIVIFIVQRSLILRFTQ